MTPEIMSPPQAVLKHEVAGPRYQAMLLIADLALPGQTLQILPESDRHSLGKQWLCMRVRVATGPDSNGNWRRFYVNPSGFVIEGGKGGAQLFDGRRPSLIPGNVSNGDRPAARLHHPLKRGNHFGSAKSIKIAAQMADGIARNVL